MTNAHSSVWLPRLFKHTLTRTLIQDPASHTSIHTEPFMRSCGLMTAITRPNVLIKCERIHGWHWHVLINADQAGARTTAKCSAAKVAPVPSSLHSAAHTQWHYTHCCLFIIFWCSFKRQQCLWTFCPGEVLYVGDVITWAIWIAAGVWSPRSGGKILLPDVVKVQFPSVKSSLNSWIRQFFYTTDERWDLESVWWKVRRHLTSLCLF